MRVRSHLLGPQTPRRADTFGAEGSGRLVSTVAQNGFELLSRETVWLVAKKIGNWRQLGGEDKQDAAPCLFCSGELFRCALLFKLLWHRQVASPSC